jgi:hypothetical protein
VQVSGQPHPPVCLQKSAPRCCSTPGSCNPWVQQPGGVLSYERQYAHTAAGCCAGYTDLGCYVYNATGHPGSTDLTGPSAYKMTPAECYRLSAAYDIFGLVNGNRCIGFASVRQAAVAAAHDGSDSCQVRCTGAAAAMCGGKSSMQLYARNKPLPQLAPVSGEGPWGVAGAQLCAVGNHWPMMMVTGAIALSMPCVVTPACQRGGAAV